MKWTFRKDHSVPLSDLRARIEQRVRVYREKYPALKLEQSYRWTSETTLIANARGGTGTLDITEKTLSIVLDVPFVALPFKSKIEMFIAQELEVICK